MKNKTEKVTHTIDGFPRYVFTSEEKIYRIPYIDASGKFRIFKPASIRKDGRIVLIANDGTRGCFSIEKIKQMGLITKVAKQYNLEEAKQLR